jgi:hypothetical protein
MANHFVLAGFLKDFSQDWDCLQITGLTQDVSQFVLEQSRIVLQSYKSA